MPQALVSIRNEEILFKTVDFGPGAMPQVLVSGRNEETFFKTVDFGPGAMPQALGFQQK